MKPVWKKSNLYQGILRRYEGIGRSLTANERRILREQLMAVAAEVNHNGSIKHKWFCHTKTLGVAFTWDYSAQGDAYWRGIYRGEARPRRLKGSR